MQTRHRFHPLYAVKLLQKRWLLLLLPLVNALLQFDLSALLASLGAEAVLLLSLAGLSVIFWRCAWWQWDGERLTISTGLLFRMERTLRPEALSCVETTCSPTQRMVGAAHLNLYFAARKTRLALYLPKRDAQLLMDALLPAPGPDAAVHTPSGFERMGLAVVSCNLFAVVGLAVVGRNQTAQVLDQLAVIDRRSLEIAAMSQLERIQRLAALWLPAGLAWIFMLAALLGGGAMAVSILRTARFSVRSGDGVLETASGLLALVHRRVRLDAVTEVDMQLGIAARISHYYPVYLKAGAFADESVPCFLYRLGREHEMAGLLPGAVLSPGARQASVQGRSIPAFLALPGALLGFSILLFIVSGWALPRFRWVFVLSGLFSLLMLYIQIEGFFTEGLFRLKDGTLMVRRTRGTVHHRIWVLAPQTGYSLFQTPYNRPFGRCTLWLRLPAGQRIRVRSVPRAQVQALWSAAHKP